jgi:hypothetical protein
MSTTKGLLRIAMVAILVYFAYKAGENNGKQLKK